MVYLQNWVVLGTWQQMYHFAFEYLRMAFWCFWVNRSPLALKCEGTKLVFSFCKKQTQGIPENKWATKTTLITFHYTGGLIDFCKRCFTLTKLRQDTLSAALGDSPLWQQLRTRYYPYSAPPTSLQTYRSTTVSCVYSEGPQLLALEPLQSLPLSRHRLTWLVSCLSAVHVRSTVRSQLSGGSALVGNFASWHPPCLETTGTVVSPCPFENAIAYSSQGLGCTDHGLT